MPCLLCNKAFKFSSTEFPIEDIITEFELVIKKGVMFDVITIVGEGEPTLYLGLGKLILELKKRTNKTVAVITNGALLYDPQVRIELGYTDIVLPTLDAYDEESFKQINRPIGTITYDQVLLSGRHPLLSRSAHNTCHIYER